MIMLYVLKSWPKFYTTLAFFTFVRPIKTNMYICMVPKIRLASKKSTHAFCENGEI